ncbi:MAG: beta-N-acetylhexosaminidase, partial [Muribaculaceae bacterium]|nr:beta-N-acetylhexosaminidase [Muribaculaceae bacterium]
MTLYKNARFAFAFLFAMMTLMTYARTVANYEVVPLPHSIETGKGKPFTLDANTTIVCANDNPQLRKNATMLAGYIKEITGMEIPVSEKTLSDGLSKGKSILLSTELLSENPEEYRIDVTPDIIMIGGATPAGNFYGIQTFRKSIPVGKSSVVEFPPVTISDSPQFGYRGAHIDVVRHFFPADSVKT